MLLAPMAAHAREGIDSRDIGELSEEELLEITEAFMRGREPDDDGSCNSKAAFPEVYTNGWQAGEAPSFEWANVKTGVFELYEHAPIGYKISIPNPLREFGNNRPEYMSWVTDSWIFEIGVSFNLGIQYERAAPQLTSNP